MNKVRIGFLLPHYSCHSRSFMPIVVRMLAESGAVVDVIHPLTEMRDLSKVSIEHDLYVLRHTSGLSLSLAGALHELGAVMRSEEHTSELQSRVDLVCRLLLEKKKKKKQMQDHAVRCAEL